MIIRLQAWIRGVVTRERIRAELNNMNPQHYGQYMNNNDEMFDADGQNNNYAKYAAMHEEVDESQLEERDTVEFKNGATYTGQWYGNMKHGYGCQKWKDGAKYEGHWKFNKACGRGKFWHVDGDIFEGEWVDDKANGYGVYIH